MNYGYQKINQRFIYRYRKNSGTSPGILINDEFFAMSGATEIQLRKKFDELKNSK